MARILVIDDDPDILWILDATLGSQGHTVEAMLDSREGLELALRHPPDLVLLDLMMPQLSGWEVLEALRGDPRTAQVPTILLSAHGDAPVRAQGIRLGADDFLLKPFLPDELLARCDRLLVRRQVERWGLRGTLKSYPLPDLLQNLEQSFRSGIVRLDLPQGPAMIVLASGRLVAAGFGALTGAAACAALLEEQEGEFRFLEEPQDASSAEAIPLRTVMLEAAWMRDELAARQPFLPAPGARLRRLGAVPTPPADFAGVPIEAVASVLGTARSLEELETLALGAPSAVRLAVAWLIQQKLVEALVSEPVGDERQSSLAASDEVRSDQSLLDETLPLASQEASETDAAEAEAAEADAEELATAIRDLQQECVFRGFELAPAVVAVIAASANAWQEVAPVIASLPEHWFTAESRIAKRQLWLDRRGEVGCGEGRLLLRVLVADGDAASVEPIVRGAAAVVLWLGDSSGNSHARAVAGAIERSVGKAILLSLGGAPDQPRPHLGGRWGRAEEAPRTLAGVLQQLCAEGV